MNNPQINDSLEQQMTSALYSSLGEVTKKSITNTLLDNLIELIMDDTLKPGYVFPNENDMCKQLNIGRSTLREAYTALAAMGFITRSKSGTYVNSKRQIASSIPLRYLLRRSDWDEVMEYRIMLESQIAYLAAKYADDMILDELDNIYEEMTQVAESDPGRMTQLDIQFHLTIAAASNNSLLLNSLTAVTTELERTNYSGYRLDPSVTIKNSHAFHKQLLGALRAHEPEQARKIMRSHVKDVYTVLTRLMYAQ